MRPGSSFPVRLPKPSGCEDRRYARRAGFLLALTAFVIVAAQGGPAHARPAPSKFVGTYRIENRQALEARGMFHFFYLHAEGGFLLAAEWPGRESSSAAGSWRVERGRLMLAGWAEVRTGGDFWRVPFRRDFRIGVTGSGIRLTPIPRKNRYGLLGWPDAYLYFREAASPNLPGRKIPTDPAALAAMIEALKKRLR